MVKKDEDNSKFSTNKLRRENSGSIIDQIKDEINKTK